MAKPSGMTQEQIGLVLALIHQSQEIAICAAKNQNAPKYMYGQMEDLKDSLYKSLYAGSEE